MSDIAIKVENLGKLYRLGEVGTGTISHDLNRWWAKLRGKEDPFAKVGETNDRTQKGSSDYVWAVKDLNFEVKKGEVLGIIGRNGAGKSTLLKLLSKVTQPTEGNIKVKGRIASLLEVGTGFHPEMTGRENIFQNGAILGMTKTEIKNKFDEIVDFSGVERYIDTPVKRYSSGMYVRLAFAVAAHLEPEILIVDEVLAVGDAEFQKKCMGKMKDVSVNDGRTVLFVSHNMGSIAQLSTHGLLMHHGRLVNDGKIDDIIEQYLSSSQTVSSYKAEDIENKPTQILEAFMADAYGLPSNTFGLDDEIHMIITVKNFSKEGGLRCAIGVWDKMDQLITVSRLDILPESGYQTYKVTIPKGLMIPNNLRASVVLDIPRVKLMDSASEMLHFEVVDTGTELAERGESHIGLIFSDIQWQKMD